MKYYTIYKITNTINGKTYIGKHVTEKVDDDYMGSGKHLKRAIAKYGVENFSKTILHVYSTEAEMNARERELVTEEWCLRADTYNLCVGGQGGFSYINREVLTFDNRSKNGKAGIRLRRNAVLKKHGNFDLIEKAWREAGQTTAKEKYKTNPAFKENVLARLKVMNTLSRTPEARTKKKARFAEIQHSVGEKNSQFGTCWITNGTENKKIKKVDIVPLGWYNGRVTNTTRKNNNALDR